MKAQNNCFTQNFFKKNLRYIYFVNSLEGNIKKSAILCKIKPNEKEKEIYALITSCEIINKVKRLNNGKEVEVALQFGKNYLIDKEKNVSVFEVEVKKDNELPFVELDYSINANEYNLLYDDQPIFSLTNNTKENDSIAFGKIKTIKKSQITLEINEGNPISDFAPIFKFNNNNSKNPKNPKNPNSSDSSTEYPKLIGFYTKNSKYKYYNNKCLVSNGIFLKEIMKKFIKNYKKNEFSVINLNVKADEKDVNQNVFYLCSDEFKNEKSANYISKILNDPNTELYINGEKKEKKEKKEKYLENYFIPEKEGEYNIKLQFDFNLEDCSYMFAGCENIIKINFEDCYTENVTDMKYMFRGCKNLKYLNMLSFNTINVTNFKGMFYDCKSLIYLNLSSFDTKKVTNMSEMFYNCYNLKNIDLFSFNTSNVIDMSYMFYFCGNLNELDLSHFDTNKVCNMCHMFNSCKKLEKILLVNHNSDCNFEYMFLECPNNIAKDFCEKNNLNSFLPKMIIMNKNVPSDNKINEESKSIRYTNSNKLFERFNQLKNHFYFTFINMILIITNNICSNIVKIWPLFKRKKLKTVEYDDKTSETSEEELISNNNSWTKCNRVYLLIKVDEKDVNKEVFYLSNNKFKSDENENSIYNNDNLKDLNDSNTQLYINEEKQENFKRYFIPKKKDLYEILLKFNISLTDCSYMFARCENILKINFKDFNTENVTNMEYMFFGCKNMEYVNMLSFNTKKVTNMSGMFYDCNSLEDLNLSSFETKNVTNMSKMFYNCYHLNSIDLNSFNTINVINMSYMFYFCCNLNSLNLSHFNTNKVSDLSHMFDSCSKLKKLSLFNYCINKVKNSYNTTKIINCEGKFLNCSNLESIDYFEVNDKNSSIY